MKRKLLLNFFLFFSISCFSQKGINPEAIEIVRDSFGVPHIFAKTDAEVAYGLAWAQAEDDFKSMQEMILPAKGLMARVQGKKGAAGDYAFALFRCREITEEKWNTLSPAFLKLKLEALSKTNEVERFTFLKNKRTSPSLLFRCRAMVA